MGWRRSWDGNVARVEHGGAREESEHSLADLEDPVETTIRVRDNALVVCGLTTSDWKVPPFVERVLLQRVERRHLVHVETVDPAQRGVRTASKTLYERRWVHMMDHHK